MDTIYVNGRIEVVGDYYDGIDLARDIMGEDWYKFMKQELDDAEFEFDRKDEEIQEYQDSEQSIIEEYQGHLYDIQELLEQALHLLTQITRSRKVLQVEKFLDEARKICFKNT